MKVHNKRQVLLILQECETCIALKEELQSVKDRNDELLETTQEKNR